MQDIKQFWDLVDKKGPVPIHVPELGNCWLWKGFCNTKGYGQLNFNGKTVKAHRFIFEFEVNKIPFTHDCCHKCDNKSCVRPSHLFSGTRTENMRDMVNKGRSPNANKTHCLNGHLLSGDNLIVTKQGWRKCRKCAPMYRLKAILPAVQNALSNNGTRPEK